MNSNVVEMYPNKKEEESYHRYRNLGGIINERDYKSAFTRAKSATVIDRTRLIQAESIAKFADIELHNTENSIDQRIILYGILRDDIQPVETEIHPNQMSDQRLFAEALRMLGDTESLNKLIGAYPKISLGDYWKEAEKEKHQKAA